MNPLVFAVAFNAVVELSLLGHLGTVIFDFSVSTVMVSGSDLWLETLLQRRSFTSYISAKTVCPPKIAASSVAAGPYSNNPLTLTCGSPSSHFQRASPAVASPWLPAKSVATCHEVLRLPSASPRHTLMLSQAKLA